MRLILCGLVMVLFFGANCVAQTDLLSRVPELQETARKSNQGGLGCGSDFRNVFGNRNQVKFSELLILLEKRVEANRTGKPNPMFGDVKDLVYVILSAVPDFEDASAVPVVAALLEDKNDVIRGWAVIALIKLAERNDELLTQIGPIEFPKAAVDSAHARGVEMPLWAIIKENDLLPPVR